MRRLVRIGTIALLLSPVVAWSQEAPAIVPGSRIRITELAAGGSGRRSGTVVTAGADTVVLRLDRGGETATFFLVKISELEVSRGRTGHTAASLPVSVPARWWALSRAGVKAVTAGMTR